MDICWLSWCSVFLKRHSDTIASYICLSPQIRQTESIDKINILVWNLPLSCHFTHELLTHSKGLRAHVVGLYEGFLMTRDKVTVSQQTVVFFLGVSKLFSGIFFILLTLNMLLQSLMPYNLCVVKVEWYPEEPLLIHLVVHWQKKKMSHESCLDLQLKIQMREESKSRRHRSAFISDVFLVSYCDGFYNSYHI